MLSSLEIRNFRTFHHLRIERLGRVNLVVGKNNVGKTTLLEALRLYGAYWPPATVASILDERNEIVGASEGSELLLLESLVHGRNVSEESRIEIRDPQPGGRNVVATFVPGNDTVGKREGKGNSSLSQPGRWALKIAVNGSEVTVRADEVGRYRSGFTNVGTMRVAGTPFLRGTMCGGATEAMMAAWWDELSLTEAEDRILHALRLVAPIKRVGFVADPRVREHRIAKASLEGQRQPVPMAALGDGVVRMFQIAVAMEFAATNREETFSLLLIDEVETGVHHTLHPDLWRFILQAARALDVHVFATTHSWDCLEGLAKAVKEDEEADAQAIRLEKIEGEDQTGAVVIDREGLPIVVRDSIEVR
jgi:hypothetical protein